MNYLHSLCSKGSLESVKAAFSEYEKQALSYGTLPDFEIYNRHGVNPLHSACFYGNLDVVKFIVNQDYIPVNSLSRPPSKHYASALHYAICAGHKSVVSFLLEANADPFLKDYKGYSAHELAKLHSNKKILAIIEHYLHRSNRLSVGSPLAMSAYDEIISIESSNLKDTQANYMTIHNDQNLILQIQKLRNNIDFKKLTHDIEQQETAKCLDDSIEFHSNLLVAD